MSKIRPNSDGRYDDISVTQPLPSAQEIAEAVEFLRRDGWVVSAVEYSDVPRVMAQFAKFVCGDRETKPEEK